ncbi:ATP-binding protein [Shewanella sp. MF08487]|uniref:ATP-binding protein n=1 Tax=Shewanella sp. MF08487 TaxID=3434873 RepID=UPI003D7A69A8
MSQEVITKFSDSVVGRSNILQHIACMPTPQFAQLPLSLPSSSLKLLRVEEINDENPSAYRLALANVYAALEHEDQIQFVYLLDVSLEGVALYFGVNQLTSAADGHEAFKNLRGALEGQLPGINLSKLEGIEPLMERLQASKHKGVVLGIPTGKSQEQDSNEEDYQGIERLVRTLLSGSGSDSDSINSANWQMVVVTQPLTRKDARVYLDDAYELASELSIQVKTSVQAGSNHNEQKGNSFSEGTSDSTNTGRTDTRGKNDGVSQSKNIGKSSNDNSSSNHSSGTSSGDTQGKNWGTNTSVADTKGSSRSTSVNETYNLNRSAGNNIGLTKEVTDKRAQHLLDHIEKSLIPRLQKGVTKGLFGTAIYLAADTPSSYRRLKNTVCSTYQGGEITVSPLEVVDLNETSAAQILQLPTLKQSLNYRNSLFHSITNSHESQFSTLLTGDELAMVAGLPRHELPGLRRRKTVEFIVDLPRVKADDALKLGAVIDRGRKQHTNSINLNKADFNKHIFVTGVTGAGKTTTCLNLLIESKLPFLVIEPAKTEYRALHQHMPNQVAYYRPNGDRQRSLRLNPFALVHPKQHIRSHVSFLRNVFAAIFPMEASMPFLVEQAIVRAYEEKGWDLTDNTCFCCDDPFDPAAQAWPTMGDMIRQLDQLIPEQGMGKEFEEKYRGSLVSRLTSLTHGVLGDILNVPQSLDVDALLDNKVVIELEEIKDGEGKALMMALLLGAVSEAIRYRHGKDSTFRHLTLIEEAHRLLAKPEPGDKARAMAVDAFADLLAEVRKYGEGLIIADQIPAKLVADVIKNTHIKIVHRLFAEDDRRAMGEAMMMDEAQRDYLPNLATGEAVIFCGGWHGPAHGAIRADLAQTDGEPLSEDDINQLAVNQLWQERARYYPTLTHLGWLTQDEQKLSFADFVHSGRKALNILLEITPSILGTSSITELKQLKLSEALIQWLEKWQPIAAQNPVNQDEWSRGANLPLPTHPFTMQLLALMRDCHPTLRTKSTTNAIWPFPATDFAIWSEGLSTMLNTLATSTATEVINKLNAAKSSSRECKKVLHQLSNYQKF